ncbi:serine/threonine-protein kinase pim-2-like isoform X2 [Erpetoichthys calabaricus]|uniref:serine/threonine-protein kinase pim-2-like isoform X2 n=1 Tax=Erpetoichthys calabaricus TaxID=27687 RepID=UPI00223411C8|nr:serine/threonine-protein kinase pim-2-like isoform X2 [Erpetoichthys calabaricus]
MEIRPRGEDPSHEPNSSKVPGKWLVGIKRKGEPNCSNDIDQVPKKKFCVEDTNKLYIEYESLLQTYTMDSLIGQGKYGKVYSGYRRKDSLPVAIKSVKKEEIKKWIQLPGEMELLPLEAALLQIASSPPTSPRVICFLDRFQTSSEYLLVMERPEPCKDLYEFLLDQTQGKFGEPLAKYIFRQIVEAVIHCHSRGILHDDVKVNNILVQTTTYQVKLIDFGVGSILMEAEYSDFGGTFIFFSPERVLNKKYKAIPTNVWALGINLYILVTGGPPFRKADEIIEGKLCFPTDTSQECKSLINWCLMFKPEDRPSLREILGHPWLQSTCPEMLQEEECVSANMEEGSYKVTTSTPTARPIISVQAEIETVEEPTSKPFE